MSQSPDDPSSNPYKARPKCQGLEDVSAPTNPAVYMYRDPARCGSHAFWERVQSGCNSVELPATMIRDNDTVDTVVNCQGHVFCRVDYPVSPVLAVAADAHLLSAISASW